MQYELSISKHNQQAHTDIEKDIENKKNGLFTFILRVNSGKIVDYNLMEYVNGKGKYLTITKVIVKKFGSAYHHSE